MNKENKSPSSDEKIKSTMGSDASKEKTFDGRKLIPVILFAVAMGFVGLGFVYRDTIKATFSSSSSEGIPNKITKEEMELLVKDFNPMQLKALAENPEQKQQLIDNIKELLAIANQAKNEGFAKSPAMQQEIASIQESLLAITYDQKLNKDKGPMPPLSSITEEDVKKYWESADGDQTPEAKEAKFKAFIDAKIELARKAGQIPEGQEPSEEELKQAKEAFAKTQIYYLEARQKLDNLGSLPEAERKEWEEFKKKVDLQTKLQTAQLITQNYVQEVLTKKFEVTDEEVAEYIKANPDIGNTEEKKKKAEEVLQKIKAGGDFAELAKEFSEDPGSKDKGGLYEGVTTGQFAPEFEKAALALEPGGVTEEVVKTNFGYHVIKLEKKGETKDAEGKAQESYDVRHILISTMMKDPDNPMAREMPAEDFVKAKLEKEKQEKILNEIKANNPVSVAEDFEIPKVSEEELKKMQEEQMKQMQQMQQMQQPPPAGDGKEAPKEAAPKEAPKE